MPMLVLPVHKMDPFVYVVIPIYLDTNHTIGASRFFDRDILVMNRYVVSLIKTW
jgi:hypothetical protein